MKRSMRKRRQMEEYLNLLEAQLRRATRPRDILQLCDEIERVERELGLRPRNGEP